MALNNDFKIKNGLTVNTTVSAGSCIEGDSFIKHDGTSSQFLKADGSVDTASYTTCTGTVVAGDISSFTDCTGTVTGVTGGDGIDSSGGNTPEVTVDSTVVRTSGAQSIAGTKSFTGTICANAGTPSVDSFILATTDSGSDAAPIQTFKRNSGSPAAGDYLGQIKFKGENDADQEVVYSKITGKVADVTDGAEHGLIETAVHKSGTQTIVARQTHTDLKLINGTGLQVAGQILSGGTDLFDIFCDEAGSGSGVDSGTANKLTKYNSGGDNVEDSIVTESSSLITIAGALAVDNICANDSSSNIKYGVQVGAGGIANIGIGCCAANAMTSGFNNVAIGPAAMKDANAVCCSVAIGVNALDSIAATGDDNVAIGTSAMFNVTTTTDSVAIGREAMGSGVGSGDCNVAIGLCAARDTTSGCNNTAVGSQSMAALTTGEFNTGLGFKSLCSIIGGDRNVALGNTAGKSITSGCDNIALGHNALCGSTTGCYNVAIGRRSMIKAVTGEDNVAIGQEVLFENTTGECNVALGTKSMACNTTGSYNVSIGQQASFYALSGDHNMAMGQYALYDNWGGDYNTAIGTAAMQCNTVGSNNAALGYRAMFNNTTGNDNFAVGECALQSNVNGIGNTALGHNAFGSSVTGNYSVAIGDNAGTYFANGCTTLSAASDSIYIGRDTRGKDNNDSNSIVIGYNACSCGANTIKLGSNSITAACIQVAWTAVSDERDKTDITDLNHGLEFIGDLKPKAFKYRKTRTSSANDGVCRYGFLAQDIQGTEDGAKVIVSESNPEQLGLNSDYLVPILVKAVQELEQRVKDLEG